MSPKSCVTYEVTHPGATLEEILDEPDWAAGQNHRVGFKNPEGRRTGFTTGGPDDELTDPKIVEDARQKFELLRGKVKKGERVNFRDVVQSMTDFHLLHPERRAVGWRYVLRCTEDEIKYGQEWPANIKRKQRKDKADMQKDRKDGDDREKIEVRRVGGGKDEAGADEEQGGVDEAEAAFAKQIHEETEYIATLENNDGLGKSPQSIPRKNITIDQVDQFTPDHWFPRGSLREPTARPLTWPSQLR
ncbi:hypothetical protein IMZ48_04165, partial [Candidatus Bathyarchaeota archaeon]|nr:hypothetical protein [Candidatus Bathyarchaeota archaeon]